MTTIYIKLAQIIKQLPKIKYLDYPPPLPMICDNIYLKDKNHHVTQQIYLEYPEIKNYFPDSFPISEMRWSSIITNIFDKHKHNVPDNHCNYTIYEIPIIFCNSRFIYSNPDLTKINLNLYIKYFLLELAQKYDQITDENINDLINKKIKRAHKLMYHFNQYINNSVKNAANEEIV